MNTYRTRRDILTAAGADEASNIFPGYAWPGGYEIGYVTSDAAMLCASCMSVEVARLARAASGAGSPDS